MGATSTWGVKLDEESRARLDAALQTRMEAGEARTKAEALVSLLPRIEEAVAASGSPSVASHLASIRQAQDVISAQAAAMAKAVALAEEAERARARDVMEAQARALSDVQSRLETALADLESEKGRAEAAEEALSDALAEHQREIDLAEQSHRDNMEEATARIKELEAERESAQRVLEVLSEVRAGIEALATAKG